MQTHSGPIQTLIVRKKSVNFVETTLGTVQNFSENSGFSCKLWNIYLSKSEKNGILQKNRKNIKMKWVLKNRELLYNSRVMIRK